MTLVAGELLAPVIDWIERIASGPAAYMKAVMEAPEFLFVKFWHRNLAPSDFELGEF